MKFLLLLFVDSVFFGDWIVLSFLVLFTRVFFILVIESSVIDMTLTDAFFVALRHHFDQ